MNKKIFFLLFTLLAVQVKASAISTRDLADQVSEQLDELESTVQGNILAAHNDLGNSEYDFLANSDNVLTSGIISIQEGEEAINEQLNTIKDLANAINAEISACTDIREEVLRRLPAEYSTQLRNCVFGQNREEARLLVDARYITDVSINKVHNLRFQFTACGGNLLCLSPLVTEIELDKIRLPQNIRTEVLAFNSLLTNLRVLVEECSTSKVSEYTADASSLLSDITICVDRIIG